MENKKLGQVSLISPKSDLHSLKTYQNFVLIWGIKNEEKILM